MNDLPMLAAVYNLLPADLADLTRAELHSFRSRFADAARARRGR